MGTQKTLGLTRRFKTAHAALSYSCRLMRKFSTIICVLRCIVNRIRNQFSMRDAITSQLIGHYFSGFPFMIFQQALKKALCSLAITPILKKHINHLTILIDRTP
jgi:hypothetical protein